METNFAPVQESSGATTAPDGVAEDSGCRFNMGHRCQKIGNAVCSGCIDPEIGANDDDSSLRVNPATAFSGTNEPMPRRGRRLPY